MNSNNKISGIYSWPAIIIAFVVFWPVGLYLIVKRLSMDKSAVMQTSSGKGLKIVANVLLVLGCLGTLSGLSNGEFGELLVFLFFIIGGVILKKKTKKMKIEGDNIRKYLAIIVNGGERRLDTVASAMGKQYDDVKRDIQDMIDKGFLKNAYINENTRLVVLASDAPARVNTPQPSVTPVASRHTAPVTPALAQSRVVACACCGANNVVTGNHGECEFCGSPLK